MYNGDAIFIARIILNTTSVTAHDAGQLLAVPKCVLVSIFSCRSVELMSSKHFDHLDK